MLAHLRSCADVWGNCIAAIIAEDTPTLRAVNPTTWIKKMNYPELEFQPSLRSFCSPDGREMQPPSGSRRRQLPSAFALEVAQRFPGEHDREWQWDIVHVLGPYLWGFDCSGTIICPMFAPNYPDLALKVDCHCEYKYFT